MIVEDRDEKVALRAAESALHQIASQKLTKKTNDNVNFLSWKTGVIRFDATTLTDVCAFISDHYNAKIIPTQEVRHYKITVFDHLTLDQAIKVITMTHDLKTRKEGAMITLAP